MREPVKREEAAGKGTPSMPAAAMEPGAMPAAGPAADRGARAARDRARGPEVGARGPMLPKNAAQDFRKTEAAAVEAEPRDEHAAPSPQPGARAPSPPGAAGAGYVPSGPAGASGANVPPPAPRNAAQKSTLAAAGGAQKAPAAGAQNSAAGAGAGAQKSRGAGAKKGARGPGKKSPTGKRAMSPSELRAQLGGGAPLPTASSALFSRAYGHDLGGVRLHLDSPVAERMGARAVTTGQHVAVRPGEPRPGTPGGDQLLGHELAHVVQQARGGGAVQASGLGYDDFEAEADHASAAALSGGPARGLSSAAGFVQRDDPKPPEAQVARATTQSGDDQVTVVTIFRQYYLSLTISLDSDGSDAFDADDQLLPRLGSALVSVFNPADGPVPETQSFLIGQRVKSLIQADLPGWIADPSVGFPKLSALLAERAAIFRRQRVRAELEAALGVEPGTVDWNALLPAVHDEVLGMGGTSARDMSKADRVEMFVMALENEVAGAPPVDGGVTPPNLAQSIWNYAVDHYYDPEVVKAFPEKYLGGYVDLLVKLRYVPDGFDLSRYKPSGADLAAGERQSLLNDFVTIQAPELVTKFVLDEWTTSGATAEDFMSQLDLDGEKDHILDFLSDEFLKQAHGDPTMMRAVYDMAGARARFDVLSTVVGLGRQLEAANQELATQIDDPDPDKHPQLAETVANPRELYETQYYLATAVSTMLASVTAGASVDEALVENAAAIAGQSTVTPQLGLIALLFAIGTSLHELKKTVAEQREAARKQIADEVSLSWDSIKDIVARRGQEADVFIQNTWIPMLQTVALEWITANYDEIKDYYDHFDTRTPQVAGRYRLAAFFIGETADKLESGEEQSASLSGETVTKKDVKQLRDAAATLRAQADELESSSGQDKKKEDLQKAIEAFAGVKANILDGTYKPTNFGDAVTLEAKKRLGIGVFEYSSLWQQATRQDVVKDNPFQAWAIASWRVIDIIDTAAANLLKGFLRGALTVGSLLVPGVGGLVLAGIDIGIGIYGSAKNIGEARRRLGVARLDTDLKVQGVSVADAEHSLKMAWVSMVIEAALAGLFTALVGGMAYKGIQAIRLPNLTKLAEMDAALAAKIVERVGSTKLADQLIGHFTGDANALVEALAYVKDGKTLINIINQVKDAGLAGRLLAAAGSEAQLAGLMTRFKNYAQLEILLGDATPAQLIKLYDLVKSESAVATLMSKMNVSQATELIQAGFDVKGAVKLSELGTDALRGFRAMAQTDLAGARASAQALTSERASGDVSKLLADVGAAQDRVTATERALADAQAAGIATPAQQKSLADAKAALDQARARVERTRGVIAGESTFGKNLDVKVKYGPNGPTIEMPSVQLHDVHGTKVRMEIPLDPIAPKNGKVNAGGGDETPNCTNLNPINPDSGGPLAEGIDNHVLAGIEQMDMVFKPGSVNELISSKLRYGDINWRLAAKGAYQSMAPGGRFQVNAWTSSQAQVDSMIKAFSDAGFVKVANESRFAGFTMPGQVGAGTIISGIKPGNPLVATFSEAAATAERAVMVEKVVAADGSLRTSQTVARQLAGPRSYIPEQSILDTVSKGTRVPDPQGVPGQFMYTSEASLNGGNGTLEVLVDETSGQIRHVLYRGH